MKNRRRIAQAIVILGSVVVFVSAALHGTFGYQGVVGALVSAKVDPGVIGAEKAIWLIVSWHWIVICVLALVASFGRAAPRKAILLLCGLAVIVDAIAAYAGVGLFIGDELLAIAGVAILTAAAIFPSPITTH